MGELDGLTAAVTGAAGDIGLAVTESLLGAGAAVIALDRRPTGDVAPRLEQLARLGSIRYESVDVTDRDALAGAIDGAQRLDIVIGNAGIVEPMPFLDVTADSWQRQLDVNLTANFHLGQLAARRFLRDRTAGRLVFTGSWVGERPWPGIAPSSASKAGLQMLVRSMALELARHGIRVNLVAPGIVDAGLARAQAQRDPEYARRAAAAVPMGSLQQPEDVASAVLFLCGSGGTSITGSTLLVDGGCSLGSF